MGRSLWRMEIRIYASLGNQGWGPPDRPTAHKIFCCGMPLAEYRFTARPVQFFPWIRRNPEPAQFSITRSGDSLQEVFPDRVTSIARIQPYRAARSSGFVCSGVRKESVGSHGRGRRSNGSRGRRIGTSAVRDQCPSGAEWWRADREWRGRPRQHGSRTRRLRQK